MPLRRWRSQVQLPITSTERGQLPVGRSRNTLLTAYGGFAQAVPLAVAVALAITGPSMAEETRLLYLTCVEKSATPSPLEPREGWPLVIEKTDDGKGRAYIGGPTAYEAIINPDGIAFVVSDGTRFEIDRAGGNLTVKPATDNPQDVWFGVCTAIEKPKF